MTGNETSSTALQGWWATLHPAATEITVRDDGSPAEAGGSNHTGLYGINWTENGASHDIEVVVRMGPTEHPIFPDYDLAVQYGCMRDLAARSDVPVPAVIDTDDEGRHFGRPSYLMTAVPGRAVPDFPPYADEGWLFDLDPDDQSTVYRRAVEMMAAIHAVDPAPPAFSFLDRTEHGPRGVAQQLSHQRRFREWAVRGDPHPVLDPVEAWLVANVPDDDAPIGLDWGDAKLANLMYDGLEPVAVLDWEMAALGPGEIDLAYFIVMEQYLTLGLDREPLPGAPSRDRMIEWYEAAADRTVSSSFAWYEVFAGYRLGIILVRTLERLVDQGIFPADTDLVAANRPAAMAAELIESE